jgi:hypothetical protein
MNGPDNDELDTRPIQPQRWWEDVIALQDSLIARMEAAGTPLPDAVTARMRYVESVLIFGNMSGRHNATIDLPVPFTLADIEEVLGRPDETEPGSDAAWRAIRRKYDSSMSGRVASAGRAR